MLTQRVEQFVAASAPNEELHLILEVDTQKAEHAAASIKDLSQRMRELRAIYRTAKEPLIQAIRRYEAEGIDIIDELPSTSQFVVSGPASAWKQLISDNRQLIDRPTVSIFTNEAQLSEI